MRPILEKLPLESDASWSMLNRRLDDEIPFQWHHHPECELTLTLNSRGQRFVGDHVGAYEDADLVLIGPNLPHTWSSAEKIDAAVPHVALVLWFRQDWIESLTDGSVEFRAIHRMMRRAGTGLHFSPAVAGALRGAFEGLFAQPPAERLLGFLGILHRLAQDTTATALASRPAPAGDQTDGRARIDRVLTHIHTAYAGEVGMAELATLAALSLSGLHRMFRRHTHVSVSEYLARLRIGEACARLSGTEQPIQYLAEAVGYRSLANFNRQFRRLRHMTPRQYRRTFRGSLG